MLLAIIVWLSIIGIAFLVFGFMFKFSFTKEIREIKKNKKKHDKCSLMQHCLMIIKNLPAATVITDDVVENMVNSFFKNTVEKNTGANSLISFFNKKNIWQTLNLKNIDKLFAYEIILNNARHVHKMLCDVKELQLVSQRDIAALSTLAPKSTNDLIKNSNSEEKNLLEQVYTFHCLTKMYLLVAEATSEKNGLLLQPLNEHVSAYYYLMCCNNYVNTLERNMTESVRKNYVLENITNAFIHEYKAFFDTVDILYGLARPKLQGSGEKCCQENLDEYNSIKTIINDLFEKIIMIREDNNICESNIEYGPLIDETKTYSDMLDKLISLNEELLS